jgi:hypothetical protein
MKISVPDARAVVPNGGFSSVVSHSLRDLDPGPFSFIQYIPESSNNAATSVLSPPASLSGIRLGPPDVVFTVDEPTMNYLTQNLRSFIAMFPRNGRTPFIHPGLYESGLPTHLRSIFTVCCNHANLNGASVSSVSHAVSSTASILLSSVSSTHDFMATLELLQSLILLQIITLLYPVSNQTIRKQAENRMPFLASLTKRLFRSVPPFLPASLTSYQAWILAESVQRTIHVEHMLQGVYSIMTRGHFVLTAFVEALPLNQTSIAWDYDPLHTPEQSFMDELDADTGLLETNLISYRELTDMWDRGEITRPGLFEEMLIVACKGTSVIPL